MSIVDIYKMQKPFRLSDKTIEFAIELLNKLRGKGKGTLLGSMCASALYASSKYNDEFIPLEVILEHIHGNLRECKNLLNKLKVILKEEYDSSLTPASGEDYIKYFFRVMDEIDDEELKDICLRKVKELKGGNPKTIAGAVIYTTLKDRGIKITQREISKLLGVSEGGLRKKIAELYG